MAFDTIDVFAVIAAEEKRYLRRRRLQDGPRETAQALVQNLKERLFPDQSDDTCAALVTDAVKRKADLPIVTLNLFAWLALTSGKWAEVQALAREVINRDHHDLLAQRLVDAAEIQSPSLDIAVDRWLQTRTCRAPFEEIETRTNGQVHFCCSAWQPAPIGQLDAEGEDGFWRSESAQEIRRSVLEGDFSHCSRWHCPSISGRRLPEKNNADVAAMARDPNLKPSRVILSHDRSCNISCPSCRSDLIALSNAKSQKLNALFEDKLLPLITDAKKVKVTGSGDPFGSRHFRYLLKRMTATFPRERRIQLHTNGLLLNERAWNDLDLWGHVSSVWVSVDAADPDTYAALRRGGTWETLLPNLKFLGRLRKAGQIDSFRLDFVVQQSNYAEIGDFVDLARNVGADGAYFLRIRNWGHFSVDEFRQMDVFAVDHQEHHDLLERLADFPPVIAWDRTGQHHGDA